MRTEDVNLMPKLYCSNIVSAQEMVWQIVNGVDLEEGKKQIFLRSPFLEFSALSGEAPTVPAAAVDPNDPGSV